MGGATTALLSTLLAATAGAQSPDGGTGLEELPLEELVKLPVSTPAAGPLPLDDSPSKVYVVQRERIRQRGYAYLIDLLEDLPQVEVSRRATAEYFNMLTVRGIREVERFVVLENGFRVNSFAGTPHSIAQNFSLANAERVEVVVGPVSAVYGADAFSGVANIITLPPETIDGVALNASYGMFHTTENSLVAGKRFGSLGLSLTASLYASAEPNLPAYYPELFSWYFDEYLTRGLARVSPFAPPDEVVQVPVEEYTAPVFASTVRAELDVADFRVGLLRYQHSFSSSTSVKPEFGPYLSEARWNYTVQVGYAEHFYRALADRLTLRSSAYAQTFEFDPDNQFRNSISNYQSAFKYEMDLAAKLEEQLRLRLSDHLSATAGVSLAILSTLPKTADLQKPIDPTDAPANQGQFYPGSQVVDADGRDLSVPVDFFQLNNQNLAAYLEVVAHPVDSLTVLGGARLDQHSRYGLNIAPQAGARWRPRPGTRLGLLYGEAFRAASPYSAYSHFGTFTAVRDDSGAVTGLRSDFFRLPNPDLRPEQLRMLSAIWNQELGAGVSASLDGYYGWLQDLVVGHDMGPGTFKGWPVANINRPVNGSSARTYGGTAQLGAQWGWRGLSVHPFVAYTLSDGTLEGNPLPNTALNGVKGGVDLSWREYSLSTRVLYRSSALHQSVRDEQGNLVTVPGSTAVNLFARANSVVKVGGIELGAWLRITNLFDNRFVHVSNQVDSFPGSPQDPFRLLLGVELTR